MEVICGSGVRLGSDCGGLEGKAGHVTCVHAEENRMVKVKEDRVHYVILMLVAMVGFCFFVCFFLFR